MAYSLSNKCAKTGKAVGSVYLSALSVSLQLKSPYKSTYLPRCVQTVHDYEH